MKHFLQGLCMIVASVMLLGASACGRSSNADRDDQQTDLAGDVRPEPDIPEGGNANNSDLTIELAPYATAVFTAAEGYSTSGNVQFMRPEGRNVRVIGRLANLPEGSHVLRILQSGDCRDITGVVSSRISEIESAARDGGDAALPNGGVIATLSLGEDNLGSFDM